MCATGCERAALLHSYFVYYSYLFVIERIICSIMIIIVYTVTYMLTFVINNVHTSDDKKRALVSYTSHNFQQYAIHNRNDYVARGLA